ncbi:MAG: secretin N-terminal domain-containing protein [Steroidobacteraceae bacterium]
MTKWVRYRRGPGTRGARVLTRIFLAALLLAPALGAQSLETIQLRFRAAEDILPILQPLVPPGATLGGMGDLLLVRADAATVAQLRAVVATLDRAPRQLLITVGQATNARSGGTTVRGSGTVGSGDVQVGVNRPPQADTGASVAIRGGTASDGMRNVSSVRALEGHESFIAVGQSRPFTSTTVTQGGLFPPVVTQTTDFRDVQTGFYATPRVNGERVTLEISPRQQRVTDGRQPTVTTGSVVTTVSGRLGEWIEIGGNVASDHSSERGLGTWGTRSGSTQYSAWVKVDEVP